MRDGVGSGFSGDSTVITVDGGTNVLPFPDADAMFKGHYQRLGGDLQITGPDGATYLLIDYFDSAHPPTLYSSNGAILHGRTVAKLAGPQAPGQFAQSSAGGGNEPIGFIQTADGTVTVLRADGTTAQLSTGDPVFQNDVVSTAEGSGVGIVFIDDTIFTMTENARFVLNELIYDPTSTDNSLVVDIVQGTFAFVTGHVAGTGGMTVETPVATMGVRGTTILGDVAVDTGASDFYLQSEGDSFTVYEKGTTNIIAVITSTDIKISVLSVAGQFFEAPQTFQDINDTQAILNFFAQVNSEYLANPVVAPAPEPVNQNGDDAPDETEATDEVEEGQVIDGATQQIQLALNQVQELIGDTLGEDSELGLGETGEVQDLLSNLENEGFAPDPFALTEPPQVPQQDPDPVNALAFSVLTDEDSEASGDFSVSNPGAGTTFQVVSQPVAGVVTVSGNTFTYDPQGAFDALSEGETTSVFFTYTATQGGNTSPPATVEVAVEGINDAPTIDVPNLAGLATNEDQSIQLFGFSFNDVENDPVTVSVSAQSTITLNGFNPDGTKTPDLLALEAQFGAATFITGDGVDDEALSVFGPTNVINFMFSGFIYTPTPDSQDPGGLSLSVSDGSLTTTTNVTIAIDAQPDAPTVPNLGFATTGETAPITGAFQGFDADPGDTLTFNLLTVPGQGTFTNNGNGTFTFDPGDAFQSLGAGESLTLTATYQAEDSTGLTSNVGVIAITIPGENDAPDTTPIDAGAVSEDDAPIVIDLLAGQSDVDGDGLSALNIVVTDDLANPVSFVPDRDGTITIDPSQFDALNDGQSRTLTVSYDVSDGTTSTANTATLVVNGVTDNLPPDAVDDDLVVTTPKVGYFETFTGQGELYHVDEIDEVGFVPIQLFDLSAAELNGIDILYMTNLSNNDFGEMTPIQQANINAAVAGGLTLIFHDRYVDQAEFVLPGLNGATSIVRDFSDSTNIELLDDNHPIALGVGGVVTDASLDGGNHSNHGFADVPTLPAGSNVILTRSSPDEAVTFSYSSGLGTVFYSTIPLDHYLSESGSPTVNAAMSDYAVNLLEFAGEELGPSVITDEDSAETISLATLLANDTDPDGDALSIISVSPVSNLGAAVSLNGVITYDPSGALDYLDPDEIATDTFTYTISDGNGGTDTATVSLSVTGIDDPVTANEDFFLVPVNTTTDLDVLANDSDPDGTAVVRFPGGLTTSQTFRGGTVAVNADGKISYTPPPDTLGVDDFDYTLTNDDGTVSTATVEICIEPTITIDQLVLGTPLDDFLFGGLGNDIIDGGLGYDEFVGSQGDDTFLGAGAWGSGDNGQINYLLECGPNGVHIEFISVNTATIYDTYGFVDNAIDVWNYVGTMQDDTIVFDDALPIATDEGFFFEPFGGDDYADGNGGWNGLGYEGNQVFDPPAGIDVYWDRTDYAGPTTNLSDNPLDDTLGLVIDPYGDFDLFRDIEAVNGTQFNDTFYGNEDYNRMRGLGGVDNYYGTLNGIEELDFRRDAQNGGGQSIFTNLGTTAVFIPALVGVLVDGIPDDGWLDGQTVIDGFGNSEVATDIDWVRGDSTNDVLVGSGGDNRLRGEGGDDDLFGLTGSDRLEGGEGDDWLEAGDEADIDFSEPSDKLRGGEDNDTLVAGYGRPTNMIGDQGDDILDGVDTYQNGYDAFVRYIDENGPFGIAIEFTAPGIATVLDTYGDTDTIRYISEIAGTLQNDTLLWDGSIGGYGGGETDVALRPFGGHDYIKVNPANYNELKYNQDIEYGGTAPITAYWDSADFSEILPGPWASGLDPWGDPLVGTFGIVVDPFGDFDLFQGINVIRGTALNLGDMLVGDSGDNWFQALMGPDVFDAGFGFDTIDYREFGDVGRSQGIVADLEEGFVEDGFGNTALIYDVEAVIGTDFDDVLIDGVGFNFLEGGSGADQFVLVDDFSVDELFDVSHSDGDEVNIFQLIVDAFETPADINLAFEEELLSFVEVVDTGGGNSELWVRSEDPFEGEIAFFETVAVLNGIQDGDAVTIAFDEVGDVTANAYAYAPELT